MNPPNAVAPIRECCADPQFLESAFRANPDYSVMSLRDLLATGKLGWSSTASGEDYAAVLLPRRSGDHLTRSVDRDTVALLEALQLPGPIPARFVSSTRSETGRDILRLVLDRVLEIEVGGVFFSGIRAYAALCARRPQPLNAPGRLAKLSLAALRHGQDLPLQDADRMAAKMYFYNRRPVTSAAQQRWPNRESVLASLGGSSVLWPSCHLVTSDTSPQAWLMWSARATARGKTYKLYVSPVPGQFAAAFAALVPDLRQFRPPVLKTGSDAFGLTRPDKFVIYFDSQAALSEFARVAANKLDGCDAHGVPFTAELAGDGLLSWGIDPPRYLTTRAWIERESWRMWLVSRMANAIVDAKRDAVDLDISPWQFAMARLELELVDTHTWQPDPAIWPTAPGGA